MTKLDANVAVIIRCNSVYEALYSIKNFSMLEDICTHLLIILSIDYDEDLHNVAKHNKVLILFRNERLLSSNIRDLFKTANINPSYICFLPCYTLFSRSLGIYDSLKLLESLNADLISGLVQYEESWRSNAYNTKRLNKHTLFCTPIEIDCLTWNKNRSHSYTFIDIGGDAILIRYSRLPKVIPLLTNKITWGLSIVLSSDNTDPPKSLFYSGFQVQAKYKHEDLNLIDKIDSQLLHNNMINRNLIEIVLFGAQRLARDDDDNLVKIQDVFILDAEGNYNGDLNIHNFYKSQINLSVIGPLYNVNITPTNDLFLNHNYEMLEFDKKRKIKLKTKTIKRIIKRIKNIFRHHK